MNCEECSELLADFLLDELPEDRAAQVREHIGACAACAATYRELKGTGRALAAVATMLEVRPSEDASSRTRALAAVESKKILESMPLEKRLRYEARQARREELRRRKGDMESARGRKAVSVSFGVLGILAAGLMALAAIVLYRRPGAPRLPKERARIEIAVGEMRRLAARREIPWEPVGMGDIAREGDMIETSSEGFARLACIGGANVFLGPSSQARLDAPEQGTRGILSLRQGAAYVEVGSQSDAPGGMEPWIVRAGAAEVRMVEGSLYVEALESGGGKETIVGAIRGNAEVRYRGGEGTAWLDAGRGLRVRAGGRIPPETERPAPTAGHWRYDLVTDAEIAPLFRGASRILSHSPHGPAVEISYRGDRQDGGLDFLEEKGAGMEAREGYFAPAPGAIYRHQADFEKEGFVEIVVESADGVPPAFGLLADRDGNGVSFEIERGSELCVRSGGRLARRTRVEFDFQPKRRYVLRLEAKGRGPEGRTVLSVDGRDIAAIESPGLGPGSAWISGRAAERPPAAERPAVPGSLRVYVVNLGGTLSREWLRRRLLGE
ncbi:MAG: zf-HC2 domain-containing protein [Planctomycetota bacterium]|nr:zf-HC2 domain-containing protein [Planctomycetota bacterium]